MLWHARFQSHDDRWVAPTAFWNDSYLDGPTKSGCSARDMIMHVVQTDYSGVTVTFSALADPQSLADAVGHCFDAFLSAGEWHTPAAIWDTWDRGAESLDPRVHVVTPLALADVVPSGEQLQIFGLSR
jgi:hypothetical protein